MLQAVCKPHTYMILIYDPYIHIWYLRTYSVYVSCMIHIWYICAYEHTVCKQVSCMIHIWCMIHTNVQCASLICNWCFHVWYMKASRTLSVHLINMTHTYIQSASLMQLMLSCTLYISYDKWKHHACMIHTYIQCASLICRWCIHVWYMKASRTVAHCMSVIMIHT